MAKLTAPLLSLGATKTVGKTLTYFRSRGLNVGRQRIIPANPNTVPQQDQRTLFSQAVAVVKTWLGADAAQWKRAASQAGKHETWFSRAVRACLEASYVATATGSTTTAKAVPYDPLTNLQITSNDLTNVAIAPETAPGVWGVPVAAAWTVGTKTYDATGMPAAAVNLRVTANGVVIGFGAKTT